MTRLAALLAACLLSARPACAAWAEAASPHFRVFSDAGSDDARQAAKRLEVYDKFLRIVTGTPQDRQPERLAVYLVESREQLQDIQAVPAAVRGFYMTRVGGTAAFVIRGGKTGIPGERVILHEYTHHLTMRHHPAYYPRWYSEGFAEYISTARFTPDRVEVGHFEPARAMRLLRGRWLPLERIFRNNMNGLTLADLDQFYAESWLTVHYILADPQRQAALTLYFSAVQSGGNESDSFRSAFGMNHVDFERAVIAYRDGQIAIRTMPAVTDDSVIAVRELPPSADTLLLPEVAFRLGIADPERETSALERVRQAAARYADDGFARRVLARAEISGGDRAKGAALVDGLLADAPDDAELLYLRGTADFFAGRGDDARRTSLYARAHPWFARAARIDPQYYTAQYRAALTAADLDAPSDQTLDFLLAAQGSAPMVTDIAIDTAKALLKKNRASEAEKVLVPQANNPQNPHARTVEELLAAARAQQSAH